MNSWPCPWSIVHSSSYSVVTRCSLRLFVRSWQLTDTGGVPNITTVPRDGWQITCGVPSSLVTTPVHFNLSGNIGWAVTHIETSLRNLFWTGYSSTSTVDSTALLATSDPSSTTNPRVSSRGDYRVLRKVADSWKNCQLLLRTATSHWLAECYWSGYTGRATSNACGSTTIKTLLVQKR